MENKEESAFTRTVSGVSKTAAQKGHDNQMTGAKAPRKKGKRSSNAALLRIAPDPRVWKVALELASGDTSRIQVVSEREVIVHNHASWKRTIMRQA